MNPAIDNNAGQIPLYIGIIGHRDLREEDKPLLKQQIIEIIEEKKLKCPNTKIIILTPLAEGADRLGAYAAIDCHIQFIAVLPLKVDEYVNDFSSEASKSEFRDLLEKAADRFELPLPAGIDADDLHRDSTKRREQYYSAGALVARYSQLLIALWDGHKSDKRGGTYEIIKLRISGMPSSINSGRNSLLSLEMGQVCHILTPHKSNPFPFKKVKTVKIPSEYWNRDEEKSNENDELVLSYIDAYNRDARFSSMRYKKKIEDSKEQLLSSHPKVKNEVLLDSIAIHRSTASTLAARYKHKRYFALKILLITVVVAFIFFQIYIEYWHKPFVLLLYPLIMGLGALWFFNASARKYEQKHEDYRAFSEALRVQFYLIAAGSRTNVVEHYLQKHKGELEWVIYSLRAILISFQLKESYSFTESDIEASERLDFVIKNWIKSETNYYYDASIRYNRLSKRLETIANILFFCALSFAIMLFLITALIEQMPGIIHDHEKVIHSSLIVGTDIMLVISAAIHGYIEKMVYREQTKTYHQMFQVFNIANERISKCMSDGKLKEALEMITELGSEALVENADWLLLHRSRPMEMPKG